MRGKSGERERGATHVPPLPDPREAREILRHAGIGERFPTSLRFWGTILPPTIGCVVAILLYLFWGPERTTPFLNIAALSVLGAGKMVILLGLGQREGFERIPWFWSLFGRPDGSAFDPWTLAWLTVYLDVAFTTMLVVNLSAICRLPWIGPRILRVGETCRAVLDGTAWLRRFTFAGLVFFISIPVAGSGVVGGTFMGRLLGLSIPHTLAGMLVGSFLGASAFAGGVVGIRAHMEVLRTHPFLAGSTAALVLLAVALANLSVRRKAAARPGASSTSARDDAR
jgi:uncharacterized membrane protein